MLSACDGGGGSDSGSSTATVDPNARAKPVPFLAVGDDINHNASTFTLGFGVQDTDVLSKGGDARPYGYFVDGALLGVILTEYQFAVTNTEEVTNKQRLDSAVSALLNQDAGLGNKFRQLLVIERDAVPLNADEITELLEILDEFIGDELILINPNNPLELLLVLNDAYIYTVTSEVREQRLGSMAGGYQRFSVAQKIRIRVATEDDATFNSIEIGSSLVLDTADEGEIVNDDLVDLGLLEEDTWVLTLENDGSGRF